MELQFELPKVIYTSRNMNDIVEFHLQEHLTETFDILTTAYYLNEEDEKDLNEYDFVHSWSYNEMIKDIQGRFLETDVDPIRLLNNMSLWVMKNYDMNMVTSMNMLKKHSELLQKYFYYPTTLYKEIGGEIFEYTFDGLEYIGGDDDIMRFVYSIDLYLDVSNWTNSYERMKCFGETYLKVQGYWVSKDKLIEHSINNYMTWCDKHETELKRCQEILNKLKNEFS